MGRRERVPVIPSRRATKPVGTGHGDHPCQQDGRMCSIIVGQETPKSTTRARIH